MPDTSDGKPAPDDGRLDRLLICKRELETVRRRLNEEIGAYPAPIPACDAQFNHLLEQRRAIAEALQRIKTLIHQRPTPDIGAAETLAGVVARLKPIDGALAARLETAAGKGHPAGGSKR